MFKLINNYWVYMCNKCDNKPSRIKFYLNYTHIRYYCGSCFRKLKNTKIQRKDELKTYDIFEINILDFIKNEKGYINPFKNEKD